MIGTLENELIEAIQTSALGARVKAVASLPDLSDEALVKRFATEAPAIYVSYAGGVIAQEMWTRRFGVAAVARNSRSSREARHGDGATIGLFELIDALQALLDGKRTPSAVWYAKGDNEIRGDKLFNAGLYASVIDLETRISPDPAIIEADLEAFERYHAEHSIPRSESGAGGDGADEPSATEDVNLPQ